MKKLPKEKRDKILAIAGAGVAACAAYWYLVITTQNASIKSTVTKTAEARREVEYSDRLVKQTAKIEADFDAASARLQQIEDTMVQGDMYSWVIKTMNKFLVNHRVDIPTYTPPAVGEVGILPQFPYRAATYSIRGTAYFHDFGHFVAEFENQFPCARLQNVELEPLGTLTAKSDEAEKISFRFEIVTLVKPSAAL